MENDQAGKTETSQSGDQGSSPKKRFLGYTDVDSDDEDFKRNVFEETVLQGKRKHFVNRHEECLNKWFVFSPLLICKLKLSSFFFANSTKFVFINSYQYFKYMINIWYVLKLCWMVGPIMTLTYTDIAINSFIHMYNRSTVRSLIQGEK